MKAKAKRHPISIRLTDETIQLARKLAKLYMEDEKKLGDLVEEAILYYSAHREDESRTNALLKVTENNLLTQFKEQVESMYREFKTRDKLLAERVASLIAIQGFESTLTELMLKDIFCKSNDRENRYEELRSIASRKMKDRYTKSDMGKMAELTEKITELENEIQEEKETYISDMTQYKDIVTKLRESLDSSNRENEIKVKENKKQNEDLKKLDKHIKKLEELIDWYEFRDRRIPQIQEKNKNKFGIKQSYEKSRIEFENTYSHQKPEIDEKPKVNINRW